MFEVMQPICLGAALVIDTVLLATLLERRNWPFVLVPIVVMLAGAWLWHAGGFALVLATDLQGVAPWYLQRFCMWTMATGLMLLPCGLLHGVWRVVRHKFEVQSRPQAVYGWCYLPMLGVAPLAVLFFSSEGVGFATITGPLELPYFLFLATVNVVAAIVFLRARSRLEVPHAAAFFLTLALVLLGMTAVQALVLFTPAMAEPDLARFGRLAVTLSPVVPALLLAYFIIRYHFLQIILGRSVVYGTILGTILLFHQLAFQDVSAALPESLRLHIVFLEAALFATLILAYQPFRQRTAEGLRYLLGARISAIRERLRHLSGELSAQASLPQHDMLL